MNMTARIGPSCRCVFTGGYSFAEDCFPESDEVDVVGDFAREEVGLRPPPPGVMCSAATRSMSVLSRTFGPMGTFQSANISDWRVLFPASGELPRIVWK